MTPRVFITGITGYVGGDVLYNLTQTHPDWTITALVRSQEKADRVRKQYPNISLTIGDNSSHKTISDLASQADIVYHFADSADDEPSAKAITEGLSKNGGYWIHTSGTMILTRPGDNFDSYGHDDGESYDDWDGISALTSLPNAAPHRDIDKLVLEAGNGTVKTAIVCPPTIYGPGRGPDNQKSMQAYKSAETILKNKKGFIYAEGKNVWHQIHVQDLSDLYVKLGEAAANGGGSASWNDQGYYLAENGAFRWGDILKAITQNAYKKGLIPGEELQKVDASRAAGKYPMSVGTTAKGTSYRAKKLLGWKPHRRSLLEEVPDIVDSEAAKLGL